MWLQFAQTAPPLSEWNPSQGVRCCLWKEALDVAPTVMRPGPYRLYFFSQEPNEPPHIHVDRGGLSAKF